MPYLQFLYLLREYDVPAGLKEYLDLLKGVEKGLAPDLDRLFLLARLAFVKRPEHLDRFERAFARFFYDVDLPRVAEGDPELFHTKQFREWLERAVERGEIPRHKLWSLSREELMKRFWDRVREQMEAHHGGGKWVGTGGFSPFGLSGAARRGIRVYGGSRNRSALKVIGDRRYVEYDAKHSLTGGNIRQVLGALRHMVPVGAETELDLAETIRRTGRNGGDIELAFRRRELDRLKLVTLIDNGGYSMAPHVPLTQLLFSKIKDRFQDSKTYYFHNTIYGSVYADARRTQATPLARLLQYPPETRVFLIGDASMAPEELCDAYGSITFDREEPVASLDRLRALSDRFPYAVWLNPIPKEEWGATYGAWTLNKIREVFFMEDLTPRGIKSAVERLQSIRVPS